jgi:hypothetical protein
MGEAYTYTQIKVVWSYLLRNFDLKLASPFPKTDWSKLVPEPKDRVFVSYKRAPTSWRLVLVGWLYVSSKIIMISHACITSFVFPTCCVETEIVNSCLCHSFSTVKKEIRYQLNKRKSMVK